MGSAIMVKGLMRLREVELWIVSGADNEGSTSAEEDSSTVGGPSNESKVSSTASLGIGGETGSNLMISNDCGEEHLSD